MAQAEDAESATAMEALEKDYQETLKELTGPKGQVVEKFREEYEKLYKALLRSHESEKRLTKKIRDLNAEIGASAQKVQEAMKTAAEDQQQIATLRRDIETQQKQVETSLEKEKVGKEAMAKLKGEIADLQSRIDMGASMSPEQEEQLRRLQIDKAMIEKDQEQVKMNLDMLQRIVQGRFDEMQRIEADFAKSQDDIEDMKSAVEKKKEEVHSEKCRKEELEKHMKDLRVESEIKHEELGQIDRNRAEEEESLKKVQQDVVDAEAEEDRLEKRVRNRMEEKKKLEEKLEQELAKNEKFVQENQQRELQLRAKRDEIQQHHVSKDKLVKLIDALKKKDSQLRAEKDEVEGQRTTLKQELKSFMEKLDTMRRDGDVDRKKIEDLLRERDILNKSVVKADDRTKKQIDVVKGQETQAVNMQKDITRWKWEAQEFRKKIFEVEKQREKYGIELSQAQSKYYAAREELKMKGVVLTELKKQIANVQAKLTQQKNLYDAVCMDRNLHAKNVVEATEQIDDMRRKFKIMFHQTTALKEEIREKDNRVVRGHFKHKKVQQLNEKLKDSKEKAARRMRNLVNIVETQRTQIKGLEITMQEAEQERQAQQKELEGVVGERDILGAQLIRRNEELALLYEKIKIQQSTLAKGEAQYNTRCAEVNKLRAQIHKAKAEVATARNQVTNVEGLKREIHHLGKTLLREEAKKTALEMECENPMNVHRWRELEGSDPATYEMIQKVKQLQKLLINKTEEVVDKDAMIQEKEKLYVQLKSIISRQPGPEVAEQLSWYSQNLKEKTAHMKQMAVELEHYHTQVHDLRDDIERHSRDLAQTKQVYFQRKRQEWSMMQRQSQEYMA